MLVLISRSAFRLWECSAPADNHCAPPRTCRSAERSATPMTQAAPPLKAEWRSFQSPVRSDRRCPWARRRRAGNNWSCFLAICLAPMPIRSTSATLLLQAQIISSSQRPPQKSQRLPQMRHGRLTVNPRARQKFPVWVFFDNREHGGGRLPWPEHQHKKKGAYGRSTLTNFLLFPFVSY